jgi:hypothetical protein
MPSYLWSQETGQGQSYFEYGREKIEPMPIAILILKIG